MGPEDKLLFPTSIEAIVAIEGILENYREDRWREASEMLTVVEEANGATGVRNALLLYLDTVMSFAGAQALTDSKTIRRVTRDAIIQSRLAKD